MKAVIPGPGTAAGREWNEAVHRFTVLKWVDQWWYNCAGIPSMVGWLLITGLTYLVLPVLGLPPFMLIALGRALPYTNQFHTGYLWWRYGERSLFDEDQTWRRMSNGSRIRAGTAMLDNYIAKKQLERERSSWGRKGHSTKMWLLDLLWDRRRMPGFILGLACVAITLVIGHLGAPLWLCGAVAYALVPLQGVPEARNFFLALRHGNLKFANQPQLIPRKTSEDEIELLGKQTKSPAGRVAAGVRRTAVATTRVGAAAPKAAISQVHRHLPAALRVFSSDRGLG